MSQLWCRKLRRHRLYKVVQKKSLGDGSCNFLIVKDVDILVAKYPLQSPPPPGKWAQYLSPNLHRNLQPQVHNSGVRKRAVSKRVVSADVPPERKPERGYLRQNHPFTKPPFYLPMTLFGVDKRVVSKRVVSADVPPERKPGRRVRSPKPPFFTMGFTPERLLPLFFLKKGLVDVDFNA